LTKLFKDKKTKIKMKIKEMLRKPIILLLIFLVILIVDFKILPNTNIEFKQVSIGDEIVNTTELKPGIEEIVEVKIIFHNYVMGE
jgi:hypothetical protein